MTKLRNLHKDAKGMAIVEAAILFPIMFLTLFAFMMLGFYLPQRAMLQRATQFAATAIATEMSDTWIYYNADNQTFGRYADHDALRDGKGGVYVTLFKSFFNDGVQENMENTVKKLDEAENIPVIANGKLTVECEVKNYVVYKEVVVTATRSIEVPVDLSFIQFPRTIDLVVTSTAVVQNADEFVRNIDIAVDFVDWAKEKFPAVKNIFNSIGTVGEHFKNFFGI